MRPMGWLEEGIFVATVIMLSCWTVSCLVW